MLGKQARVSASGTTRGGNPILHHHAYLPGTHLVMLPFHLVARACGLPFDPRLVTLLRLRAGRRCSPCRLPATAARWPRRPSCCEPARLLAPDLRGQRPRVGRCCWARSCSRRGIGHRRRARVLGLACATKQLAWPFAPFLLVRLSGARRFADLRPASDLGAPGGAARRGGAAVFLAVVLPVAALDFRAFWGDIVVYNVGLPGRRQLPARRHAGLRLRELPHLLRRVAEPARLRPLRRRSTCCWCRSACCCAAPAPRGTRPRALVTAAWRSWLRSTSRGSCIPTT